MVAGGGSVDLGGGGLWWAVTVAVVVGCGGDGRWWLSVLLMIMGEGIIYYFNE